jgi:hypothetical protein
VSESPGSDPLDGRGDVEEVDAVVVAPLAPSRRALVGSLRVRALAPAVQAVAVATGSFVVGAATAGLVRRWRGRGRGRGLVRVHARRKPGRAGRRRASSSRRGERVQIVSSRSLLVDVHLLGERD